MKCVCIALHPPPPAPPPQHNLSKQGEVPHIDDFFPNLIAAVEIYKLILIPFLRKA